MQLLSRRGVALEFDLPKELAKLSFSLKFASQVIRPSQSLSTSRENNPHITRQGQSGDNGGLSECS